MRKLATLLEMLEVSKGFAKLCKSEKISHHLIVSESLLKKFDGDVISSLNTVRSSPDRKALDRSRLKSAYGVHYNDLKKKFLSFCFQGQTIGQTYLTHKKGIDVLASM